MSDKTEKIALALEPTTEKFGSIPLMKILVGHYGDEPWVQAKQFVLDLAMVAPQIVWVEPGQRDELELELAGLEIASRVVSKEEADRISIENKPIRGTIDLHIRTRDSEINSGMIKELKTLKLISGYRKGDNANDIFHWKDDRWYQDFHLTIFKKADIAQIETLISDCGYIIVQP